MAETDDPSAAGAAPAPSNQGRAAFRAGWLMAQLYGPLVDRGGGSAEDHLPSISELPRSSRVDLAVRELDDALTTAAAGIVYHPELDAVKAARRPAAWQDGFKESIGGLHLLLITEFTGRDAGLSRAYGLGRSLSDTAWLPSDPTVLQQELNPYRVAELDGWLAGLTDWLDRDAVTAVRGSLQAWSAWVAAPFIGRRKLDWSRDGRSTELALRRQGAIWHDLLSGEREAASLLTAQAYVGATDIALHRAGSLTGQVLARFWYALVVLLAGAGGLIYLSVTYGAGMAKFWGVFATAAGGSGALVQGVRRGLATAAQRTGSPLGHAERDDALQAGATRLPAGAAAGRVRRRVHPTPPARPAAASAITPPVRTPLPTATTAGVK